MKKSKARRLQKRYDTYYKVDYLIESTGSAPVNQCIYFIHSDYLWDNFNHRRWRFSKESMVFGKMMRKNDN